MNASERLKASKLRRKMRIRKRVIGTTERPRLAVSKSLKYISAQIIDDTKGITLVSASTIEKDMKGGKNVASAEAVGKLIGERAKQKNIVKVVFDRSGFSYQGKLKALADAARAAGLAF
ncbi:MAG: 50S ribosomal protein L18 [Spirochaetota bacterium]